MEGLAGSVASLSIPSVARKRSSKLTTSEFCAASSESLKIRDRKPLRGGDDGVGKLSCVGRRVRLLLHVFTSGK